MTFNKTKVLNIAVLVLTVTGTLLSAIAAKSDRADMKAELLTELLNSTKES